ncbi:hypothetical protein [Sulfitobacter sp.]|uniref:hypothetical protein n=1 Tax=Sulfitobacter sp. TaxID=1903071 RepID=UPI0030020543
MRYDELRALIHRYFKKALSLQMDRLNANGPMSDLELAPAETARALSDASDEEFWDMIHPEGTEGFLRQFCGASGVPQSEETENPARILREYKLAFRDMLKAWEIHRQSLNTYEYYNAAVSSAPDKTALQHDTSYTLQHAIDEYINENKRAGTSQPATIAKKTTNLSMLTELFDGDRSLATLTKQDAQHVKRILLELPANRNKMAKTRELSEVVLLFRTVLRLG